MNLALVGAAVVALATAAVVAPTSAAANSGMSLAISGLSPAGVWTVDPLAPSLDATALCNGAPCVGPVHVRSTRGNVEQVDGQWKYYPPTHGTDTVTAFAIVDGAWVTSRQTVFSAAPLLEDLDGSTHQALSLGLLDYCGSSVTLLNIPNAPVSCWSAGLGQPWRKATLTSSDGSGKWPRFPNTTQFGDSRTFPDGLYGVFYEPFTLRGCAGNLPSCGEPRASVPASTGAFLPHRATVAGDNGGDWPTVCSDNYVWELTAGSGPLPVLRRGVEPSCVSYGDVLEVAARTHTWSAGTSDADGSQSREGVYLRTPSDPRVSGSNVNAVLMADDTPLDWPFQSFTQPSWPTATVQTRVSADSDVRVRVTLVAGGKVIARAADVVGTGHSNPVTVTLSGAAPAANSDLVLRVRAVGADQPKEVRVTDTQAVVGSVFLTPGSDYHCPVGPEPTREQRRGLQLLNALDPGAPDSACDTDRALSGRNSAGTVANPGIDALDSLRKLLGVDWPADWSPQSSQSERRQIGQLLLAWSDTQQAP